MTDSHLDGYTDYPHEHMTDDEVREVLGWTTGVEYHTSLTPEHVARLARECLRRGELYRGAYYTAVGDAAQIVRDVLIETGGRDAVLLALLGAIRALDKPMTDDEVREVLEWYSDCDSLPCGDVVVVARLARECLRRGLRLAEFERRDEITVRRNEDGSLDEIMAYGWAHLEQMSDQCWALVVTRTNGDRVNVAIHSKGGRAHVSAIVLEPTEHAD